MTTETPKPSPSPQHTWIKKQIGQRLRLCRVRLGMSQVEAAKRIDVTKEHLSVVERGGAHPSLDMLARAAEVYGTELVNFFLFSASAATSDKDDEIEACRHPKPGFANPLITGAGVWTMDYASGRDFWSTGLRRMLGFSEKVRPGMAAFIRVVQPGDAARMKRFLSSLRERKCPCPLTCAILREDGIVRRCFLMADQLEDESDIPDQARLVLLDITDWEALRSLLGRNDAQLTQLIEDKTSALRQAAAEAQRELRLREIAERTAETRKAQLQQVLAAVPAILYSFSPHLGGTQWHSPHMQRILGISKQELHADPLLWHNSIHPEDLPRVDEAFARARHGRPVDVEYRIQGRDGQWRWLHDRAEVFRDASGQAHLAGVAVNITKAKLAAEALERLSREYEIILNTTQSSIFLLGVDDQARLVFERLNPREEELTGLTTEAVRGKTPIEALGPEIGGEVERNYRRCLERKEIISYEETLTLPGGERTWLTQLSPVLEGEQVVKIVGSGLDITDRKQAEQALRESEARLRLVADGTADWEYWILPHGGLEYCSPSCERITGYTVAEFFSDPGLLQRIVHPEHVQAWNAHVHRAARDREPGRITYRIINRAGREIWIEHHCVALVDEQGRYRGRRASNRDVTERVRVERELRRENERLRQENERLRGLPG